MMSEGDAPTRAVIAAAAGVPRPCVRRAGLGPRACEDTLRGECYRQFAEPLHKLNVGGCDPKSTAAHAPGWASICSVESGVSAQVCTRTRFELAGRQSVGPPGGGLIRYRGTRAGPCARRLMAVVGNSRERLKQDRHRPPSVQWRRRWPPRHDATPVSPAGADEAEAKKTRE